MSSPLYSNNPNTTNKRDASALSRINEAVRVTNDRVIDRSKRDASSWRICRVRHKRTWYLCKSPGSRGTLLSYDKRETRGNTFRREYIVTRC